MAHLGTTKPDNAFPGARHPARLSRSILSAPVCTIRGYDRAGSIRFVGRAVRAGDPAFTSGRHCSVFSHSVYECKRLKCKKLTCNEWPCACRLRHLFRTARHGASDRLRPPCRSFSYKLCVQDRAAHDGRAVAAVDPSFSSAPPARRMHTLKMLSVYSQ